LKSEKQQHRGQSRAAGDGPNREWKVCLLGASLDGGNMGVRALGVSFIQLVLRFRPDARIYLLYGNRSPVVHEVTAGGRSVKIPVVNFRLSPRARPREHLIWICLMALVYRWLPIGPLRRKILASIPWLRAVSEADFIGDIRGGDSFSDIYGFRRFLIQLLPCLTVLAMRRELVLLPQTYGPYNSRLARLISRAVIRRAAGVYAREHLSIAVLNELLAGKSGPGREVRFCPDVAFTLESRMPEAPAFDPPIDLKAKPRLVGLNVSGLLYAGGYSGKNMFGLKCDYPRFVHELIDRILAETDAHVLIVPHEFGGKTVNDSGACREVWNSIDESRRDRVHLAGGRCDQSEIKAVVGLCDFMIGSRMHSCIAGLSQAIPSVGVAYSRKFLGVFESAGVGDLALDARRLTTEELVEACMERLGRSDRIAAELKEKIPRLREEIYSCFRDRMFNAGDEINVDAENKRSLPVGSA
jgi:polysaccharide pyruvyl transferase WcaK-like protein